MILRRQTFIEALSLLAVNEITRLTGGLSVDNVGGVVSVGGMVTLS